MTYASYAKLRDARGLKDNDVAHLAGIPQSTFSAWKKGDYKPKEEKRRKIANCLQVSLDELDGTKGMEVVYQDGHGVIVTKPELKQPTGMLKAYQDVKFRRSKVAIALMDAARGCTDEEIKLACDMLKKFKASRKAD